MKEKKKKNTNVIGNSREKVLHKKCFNASKVDRKYFREHREKIREIKDINFLIIERGDR